MMFVSLVLVGFGVLELSVLSDLISDGMGLVFTRMEGKEKYSKGI
jgi:hypothetical protein